MLPPRTLATAKTIRDILTARPGQLVTYTEIADGAGIQTRTDNPRAVSRAIAVQMVEVRNMIPRNTEIVAFDGRGYMLLATRWM